MDAVVCIEVLLLNVSRCKSIIYTIEVLPTDSGQKYSDTSNIPYIFHIKQNISKNYPAVNSSLILIIFITITTELNVVLLYNFKIIFYDKHFEIITQVKHTTELISFKTQCNDSTFVTVWVPVRRN
jgi:hypothetical protein